MNNPETLAPVVLDPALIKYDVTAETISKIEKDYGALTIAGPEDKPGYSAVETARKAVKSLRINVENRRKDLKQGIINFGREVDSQAKTITDRLLAIEKPLAEKSAAVDAEIERRKKEKEMAAKARLQGMIYKLEAVHFAVGVDIPYDTFTALTDDDFAILLESATANYNTKQAELQAKKDAEAEEARIKAEAEAKERQEKEEELAQLRAEAAANKAKADADALAARKREEEHAAEIKRLKDEAEAKAETERKAQAEKDRIAKEESDRKLAEAKAETDRLRKEKENREAAEQKARDEQAEKDRLAATEAAQAQKMEDIKVKFPTLELAWNEIVRLMK